jgi:hypothetical protein
MNYEAIVSAEQMAMMVRLKGATRGKGRANYQYRTDRACRSGRQL